MVPEEVTAHPREVATDPEEASVEVPHLLAGTAEDVAGTDLLEWDLDPVGRLHQAMVRTLTTDLKVA